MNYNQAKMVYVTWFICHAVTAARTVKSRRHHIVQVLICQHNHGGLALIQDFTLVCRKALVGRAAGQAVHNRPPCVCVLFGWGVSQCIRYIGRRHTKHTAVVCNVRSGFHAAQHIAGRCGQTVFVRPLGNPIQFFLIGCAHKASRALCSSPVPVANGRKNGFQLAKKVTQPRVIQISHFTTPPLGLVFKMPKWYQFQYSGSHQW